MNKIYFPNLNGLRFFAALSVMIYHFFGLDVLNGHYGVVLFFVLSGFLITYLLLEEKSQINTISIRKFYARRILRIWPLYFFILLVSTIAAYCNGGLDSNYSEAIPYFLFFIPNWAFVVGIGIKYASILWSVGAEEQFYILWPWLMRKISLNRLVYIFLIIILIWTFAPHIIDFINHRYLSENETVKMLPLFMNRMGFGAMATGAMLAYIAKYQSSKLNYIFHPYILIFVIAITLIIWGFNLLYNVMGADQIYSILFAITIGNFALNPNVIFSLENKAFNYLGKISFGLYVYHLIAFDFTNHLFLSANINLPKIPLFILGGIVTVLFASLSYYYLEKPFLRLKSKRFTIIKSGSDVHNTV